MFQLCANKTLAVAILTSPQNVFLSANVTFHRVKPRVLAPRVTLANTADNVHLVTQAILSANAQHNAPFVFMEHAMSTQEHAFAQTTSPAQLARPARVVSVVRIALSTPLEVLNQR